MTPPAELRRRGYVGLGLGSRPEPGQAGLLVRSVAPGSAAEQAGVRAGDRLTHIENNPAIDLNEVRLILRALRAGDPLLLTVERGEASLTLASTVQAFPLERYSGARLVLDQVDLPDRSLRVLWVFPDREGPFPAVYYLPGAHWASEEYPQNPGHPVPSLIGALARAGVATLRVERSGMGDSQGPPCTRVDWETELAGYRAGMELLHGSEAVRRDQVFLFGHSLGAMVAPLLAGEARVRGIVTYGASAIPISEGLVGAIVRYGEMQGSAAAREETRGIAELIRLVVAGGRTPADVLAERPDLRAIAPEHFRGDQAYHRIVTFYHQLERCDLAGVWKRLATPSLFVHGSRDWISTGADSEQLAALCGPSGRYLELEGADHQLSDAGPGEPERLAPALEAAILDWIGERLAET